MSKEKGRAGTRPNQNPYAIGGSFPMIPENPKERDE